MGRHHWSSFFHEHLHRIQKALCCCNRSFRCHLLGFYRFLATRVHPFYLHVCYFLSVSFLGFLALKFLKLKNPYKTPRNIDVFFTSVSAATVSSMATVEMEVFSNSQLVVMTILMLVGGEVFTSMLGLLLRESTLSSGVDPVGAEPDSDEPGQINGHIEMGLATPRGLGSLESGLVGQPTVDSRDLKHNAVRCLAMVVLSYLVLIHVGGSVSILAYLAAASSARNVLKEKHILLSTFSVFTTVSSFSNCGFIPTNENMLVFKKNTGLLLLIVPQVLAGNTLFPPFLRLVISVLLKLTKRPELEYMLRHGRGMGYYHLLPWWHSVMLAVTVLGFILLELVLFCCMEWRSAGSIAGMSPYQRIVSGLFVSVNVRHAGESTIDLSTVSAAILVLFVVMMYLPPYTSFLPLEDCHEDDDEDEDDASTGGGEGKSRLGVAKTLIVSQLSYIAVFVMLVCITERQKLMDDPLNFNVLNIVVEVVSAYGNVGFSTGYSCARRLKPDGDCKDAWYGFVGRWSDGGKVVLIVVMFFGRLKKFNMRGGRAWKLI